MGGGHRGAASADLITFKQRLRKATFSAVAPDEPSRLAISRITARAWMANFCESLSIGRHNTKQDTAMWTLPRVSRARPMLR